MTSPLLGLVTSWPGICVLLVSYYASLWMYRKSKAIPSGTKLPPGPKGRPFVGNLHQLPRSHSWLTFTTWAREYGSLVYIHIFGSGTVIVNSAKAATQLLEGRSGIYSDRPPLRMSALAGRDRTIFFCSTSNPRFKALRRVLNRGLNVRETRSYETIQIQEAHVLLKSLLDSPHQFQAHIRRNSVAIILKVAYGYDVKSIHDDLVHIVDEGIKLSSDLLTPGRYMVEAFPFLRFLPEWFPGAGFKTHARKLGKEIARIDQVPLAWAKERLATGDYVDSFVSKHLMRDDGTINPDAELQDIVQWASAALYVGGGDTTVSTLTSFFLLMALNPGIQKRAQEDIERVTQGRLPTLDDYPSLPYLRAILQEVMRLYPVLPLGIVHRVTEDDIYENMFIPKGARIIPNVWAITHDEDTYPDPFVFNPDRHLGPNPQIDPFKFVFGFGKRLCPGAHLAEMTMFLNMAHVLALFDIRKPLGLEGKTEIEPKIEWTSGTTVHLKPFELRIVPRSPESAQLIERLT